MLWNNEAIYKIHNIDYIAVWWGRNNSNYKQDIIVLVYTIYIYDVHCLMLIS